jgi:hypothetical protein
MKARMKMLLQSFSKVVTFTPMKSQKQLILTLDLEAFLLWGLLESLSLDQLVILGLVAVLHGLAATAPSSCR